MRLILRQNNPRRQKLPNPASFVVFSDEWRGISLKATMQNKRQEEPITMRDLYPHLNEEQLKEAEENFERYIEVALEVYEDICANRSPVERRL
jgi:hypothetical protein